MCRLAHKPFLLLSLAVVSMVATSALAAQPAGGRTQTDVRTDAFSVRDLARDAGTVAVGGSLSVSGLELAVDAGQVILDLERFQVFADGAEVVIHGEDGDEVLPAPDHAHFRGRVAGDLDSMALLSVTESGRVRGLVQQEGAVYVLREGGTEVRSAGAPVAGGPLATGPSARDDEVAAGPTALEAVALTDLDAAHVSDTAIAGEAGDSGQAFTCGNAELTSPDAADLLSRGPLSANRLLADLAAAAPEALTTTPYTAQVAVETDYEYFQKFGNTTDATDYLSDLFGFASAIYDDELNTDLQISYVSLWTTSADPWTQTISRCAMYEFGRYWNDNRTGVERTIAHLVSGKSSNSGIAWVGVLCQGAFNVDHFGSCPALSPQFDNYGGGYGFTGGIDGNFNPNSPSVVWDIMAVSHEIGHNFSSPHTHCYENVGGSSQAVDQCYGTQTGTGCYSGSASYPSGCPGGGQSCGTLMSYCHFLSGGLSNIALTFGEGHPYGVLPQRVPDRMRTHVEENAACMPRIGACTENLTLTTGTDNGTETYSVCGTITAGSNYSIGSNGNVTFEAGKVVLTNGFEVASGGTLRVDV